MPTAKTKSALDRPRSFRTSPVPWTGTASGLLIAALVSQVVLHFGNGLLAIHEDIRHSILAFARIPVTAEIPFRAFRDLNTVVGLTPMADYRGHPWLLIGVLAVVGGVLGFFYQRLKLGRTFAILLILLLISSTVQALVLPDFGRRDAFLVTFWIRFELVNWILAPWLAAIIGGLVEPSWWLRSLWIALAPGHGFLWSSLRLSFCTIALYYAGPALILILWTLFGILADLVSVCLFYSLIVYFGSINRRRDTIYE
jgi:hypothetical protein